MKACRYGNEEFNLECICEFLENNKGKNKYTCIFCGIYEANKARCNKCEIND